MFVGLPYCRITRNKITHSLDFKPAVGIRKELLTGYCSPEGFLVCMFAVIPYNTQDNILDFKPAVGIRKELLIGYCGPVGVFVRIFALIPYNTQDSTPPRFYAGSRCRKGAITRVL